MRHHNDRHAQHLVAFTDQVQDFGAGPAVEIPRGLIRQKQFRLIDQGPRESGSLLLSARKFARAVMESTAEPYALQSFAGERITPAAIDLRKA